MQDTSQKESRKSEQATYPVQAAAKQSPVATLMLGELG